MRLTPEARSELELMGATKPRARRVKRKPNPAVLSKLKQIKDPQP